MTSEMTHWERVRAAIRGEEVDRPPISLWRHWPVDDQDPAALALATVQWQKDYDFDLVKFPASSSHSVEDWGSQTSYTCDDLGIRNIDRFGVTTCDQWATLKPLDPTQGQFGLAVSSIGLVADALEESVPVIQTVFSPLATARKLAGDRVMADLRRHPEALKQGLQTIAETTIAYAQASLQAGADGIFYAVQNESYQVLSEAEYREFGETYDRLVLDAVRSEADIILLHAHGEEIMFDLVASYPADGINWHDRLTWPTLRQARQLYGGLLVGGIAELSTLVQGPTAAIEQQVAEAIAQCEGRGLLVGPGCVLPINIPISHLWAARRAVEE
jgi:uroporphyrinogen decarboxylase